MTETNSQEKDKKSRKKKGLVIVNTGDGKGKTTAALGMMMRAWGRGMRVIVVQFIKAKARNGETRAAEKMGIEFIVTGDGFTWNSKDIDKTIARARKGWEMAQALIVSSDYEMIILDELTYPLHFGWLDVEEVIEWLRANKPQMLHLVITGRDAPSELLEFADLVTEAVEIKHPFNEQDIGAQPGVEY